MMASRMKLVSEAVRPALKSRLLIAGPAGAGKTESALRIAVELLRHLGVSEGRPLVIDTERESALTYAKKRPTDEAGFGFDHLPWEAPYSPAELAETLDDVNPAVNPVVIVDSLSHFWSKEGSTLDIAGGRFTGWKEARPVQNEMVEAILRCRAHVIVCSRQKMEYTQEPGADGKQTVRKLGLALIQSDDLEYEVNVTLNMSVDHMMAVTKSRAGEDSPVGRVYPPARGPKEFAEHYAGFLAGGIELLQDVEAERITSLLNLHTALRKAWRAAGYPAPKRLPRERLPEVIEWLTGQGIADAAAVAGDAGPLPAAGADPGPAEAPAAPDGTDGAGEASPAPEAPPEAAEGDAPLADEVAAASKARAGR